MSDARLPLYASPNGDRWSLCRGEGPADVFVLHEANIPSGGVTSRVELGPFLLDGTPGPQHEALLRLLGALVDRGGATAPTGGPAPEAGAAAAEPTPGEDAR
jgi:hypothetical protein